MNMAALSIGGRYDKLDYTFPLLISSFPEYVFGMAALWTRASEVTMMRGHDDMRI
jgi:hypothetical protein